jgi:putative SOS response-associated peptidase YedK
MFDGSNIGSIDTSFSIGSKVRQCGTEYTHTMSRRYVSPDQVSIDQEFDLVRTEWVFPGNFNVSPADVVPIIRVIDDQPDTALLKWGFGDPITYAVPVEMIDLNATDRGLVARGQRCIVPALGFYAWHANASGSRQPFYVHTEDQDLFGFAGFWERESCVIVTLPATAMMAEIDNGERRMPAILAREMRDVWLYGSAANAAAALVPYPDERLVAYRVGGRVDSTANNDETLIEPLETNVD